MYIVKNKKFTWVELKKKKQNEDENTENFKLKRKNDTTEVSVLLKRTAQNNLLSHFVSFLVPVCVLVYLHCEFFS